MRILRDSFVLWTDFALLRYQNRMKINSFRTFLVPHGLKCDYLSNHGTRLGRWIFLGFACSANRGTKLAQKRDLYDPGFG